MALNPVSSSNFNNEDFRLTDSEEVDADNNASEAVSAALSFPPERTSSPTPSILKARVESVVKQWAENCSHSENRYLNEMDPKDVLYRILQLDNIFSLEEISQLMTSDFPDYMKRMGFTKSEESLYTKTHHYCTTYREILNEALKLITDKKGEILNIDVNSNQLEFNLESYEKMAYQFGYPIDAIEKHGDFFKFLYDSRLLYAIQGYKMSQGSSFMGGVAFDPDGHPKILVEGNLMRWETLLKKVEFHKESKRLVSKGADPKNESEQWNYFRNVGLVKINGFHDPKLPQSIYTLSKEEMDKVRFMAKMELAPGEALPKDACFFQVFVAFGDMVEGPLFKNLNEQSIVHVGVALINEHGELYAPAFELSPESQPRIFDDMPKGLLKSGHVKISKMDFTLFKPKNVLIATIPMKRSKGDDPQEKNGFDELMGEINRIAEMYPRYNSMSRNCSYYCQHLLKFIGEEVNFETTTGEMLSNIIPDIDAFLPDRLVQIHATISAVASWIFNAIPSPVRKVLSWTWTIVTYVPRKILVLFHNSMLIPLGAMEEAEPVTEVALEESDPSDAGEKEEILKEETKKAFPSFKTLMNLSDLLSDEISTFHFSSKIRDWLRKRPSASILPYENGPRFYNVSYGFALDKRSAAGSAEHSADEEVPEADSRAEVNEPIPNNHPSPSSPQKSLNPIENKIERIFGIKPPSRK